MNVYRSCTAIIPVVVRLCILIATTAASNEAIARSESTNDVSIKTIIEKQLLYSENASPKLDVETKNGVVRLSGSVDSLLAKREAVDLARKVRGVKGIIDLITVRAPTVSDDVIQVHIESALSRHQATEPYDVHAQVENGVVTLTGNVDSNAERQLCIYVVSGIRGVRQVRDQLGVDSSSGRADSEILKDIRGLLAASVWIHEGNIDVQIADGAVRLTGDVGSLEEHQRVVDAAWVEGVVSVDHKNLAINDWIVDKTKRRKLPEDVQRSTIVRSIQAVWRYDPRISGADLRAQVDNDGKVIISGQVRSLDAKEAAAEDAQSVYGVRRVENLAQVGSTREHPDVEIERFAQEALAADARTTGSQIDVFVRNGHVHLYGNVETTAEKRRAEELVSRLGGVVDITNKVAVAKKTVWKADSELEEDIENDLWWNPFINSEDLSVAVDNGVAELRGSVDSYPKLLWARDIALKAGADSVLSKIVVEDVPAAEAVE